jgi:hypothetical protein
MALQRDTKYPGRFTASSAGQPQGAFKNRTSTTSKDGSYLEKDWANDWSGFFSSLLDNAGLTPDGNVDEVGASQYFEALEDVCAINDFLASSNGYAQLPSGIIIQWGVSQSSVSADTAIVETYPIAFPTAAFQVVASHSNAGATNEKSSVNVYSVSSLSSFTYNLSASGTQDVRWIAVGY